MRTAMQQAESESPHPGLSFRAFVALVASLMMLNALAIDMMVPALPAIAGSLGVGRPNDQQWIITAYVLGFGAAQLIHGTLADRFGRRPVLLFGLGGYIGFSLLATLAWSFPLLIAARVAQGIAAAATRIIAVSIVRDCYAGRTMARVMSLAFIVFLLVPILAPTVGALVLLVAPWRGIFGVLTAIGLAVLLFAGPRLPETLPPERRRAITPAAIMASFRIVAADRVSTGYTVAATLLAGSMFGFLTSVQQISYVLAGNAEALPLVFVAVGSAMAVASWLNSRIVEAVGTRRVSHSALIAFTLVSLAHLAVARAGLETIGSFALFQALAMASFALCGSNFSAMAMERLGHVAGAAASLQGFVGTFGGALIGSAIGQSYDGTSVPVAAGYATLGIVAILAVLVTERGRLFRPHFAAVRS